MKANTFARRLYDALEARLMNELDTNENRAMVRRLAAATEYLWEQILRSDDVPNYYKNA
jgi:hypothetical protein